MFIVEVDYEIPEKELGLYGKNVKQTIFSFKDLLEKSNNFDEYKNLIILQLPFYSLDLLLYRVKNILKKIKKGFENFWEGLNILNPTGPG